MLNEKVKSYDSVVLEDSGEISKQALAYANSITKHLDEAMQQAYPKIKNIFNEDVSTEWLQGTLLTLSTLLFFISSKAEDANIRSDVARATAKDAYECSYLNACAEKDEKGKSLRPVEENKVVANQEAKEAWVVSMIYERAAKMIARKIDAGNEMVSTLRKVITMRISQSAMEKTVDASNKY